MRLNPGFTSYYESIVPSNCLDYLITIVRRDDLSGLATYSRKVAEQLPDDCSEARLIALLFTTAVSESNDLEALYSAWQQLPTDSPMQQAAESRIVALLATTTNTHMPNGLEQFQSRRSSLSKKLQTHLDHTVVRVLAKESNYVG